MIFSKCLSYAALLFSIVCAGGYAAEPHITPISLTTVQRVDVVEAASGKPTLGSLEFALREGENVHYFVSAKNCGEYVANPSLYPDVSPGVRLAFMGADPVSLFPKGVHNPKMGAVEVGSLDYVTTHKGAMIAFTTKQHLATFSADPQKYIPEVGGYCLGAMSRRSITPGDPRNAFFVPEAANGGSWALFGSPDGKKRWEAMTSSERRHGLAVAHAYYRERVGPEPNMPNVVAAR